MKASTISAATAAISRRLTPDDEPPTTRESRLAAAAELAMWIAIAIFRAIFEILNAIVGVILSPFTWAADRIVGRRAPTAVEYAEAVVDAPPPARPAFVRPVAPIADHVRAHVMFREYWHKDRVAPAPLPPDLAAWFESLTSEQRKQAASVDPLKLERHIAAGRAGSTAWGPGNLRPVKPIPLMQPTSYAGANGKAGGKGSMRVEPVSAELSAALAECDVHLDYGYPAGGHR